jgi:hypothetical protein
MVKKKNTFLWQEQLKNYMIAKNKNNEGRICYLKCAAQGIII